VRRLRKFPHQRVFAPARTDDQEFHQNFTADYADDADENKKNLCESAKFVDCFL